jgi:hypothetical protein
MPTGYHDTIAHHSIFEREAMSDFAKTYKTFRGLPPVAGLATMEEAARPGMSVEQCVARLKRLHYCFMRLHEILTARITAEPIYELKTALSLHSYWCAEHVKALRERVAEMREPPLGLEQVPHEGLRVAFDEILAAPTTEELVLGVYAVTLPLLDEAISAYRQATNPLTDAPSVRVLRFAQLEVADMIAYGEKAAPCLVAAPATHDALIERLRHGFASAGGILGDAPESPVPERVFSKTPYIYERVPRRDERWQDLWNQGVNAEAFIYDEHMPAKAKTLMLLFKRLREIDVPEMMASIIIETKGKPWDYYRDMSRQLWDEARHAMMGEVGFAALGVDWTKARITHNWSHRLNTECTPLERHAVLYFIEQGLMTKTGKRYEWEVGQESGIPLMATIQDFDWADEVLHAQLGRQWYIPMFADWKEAIAYGDQCWTRILSNWEGVRDQGLTKHENWWPTVYKQACAAWKESPNPTVLAYAEDYSGTRADLKNVATSA